jgi:predicted methyltransferase
LLGPYLAAGGRYLVAHPPRGSAENDAGYKSWSERVARLKAHMGPITETTLGKGQYELAPPGSVDLVLTFRNLHNWVGEGDAGQVLAACFKALKPGGILGVEDHRGRGDRPQDPKAASGYLREDFAIDLIRHAGFELVGKSELNANPKDTTDWPRGVWTLPPSFALGAQDHDKYAAIGEADNFVLKFRKPLR